MCNIILREIMLINIISSATWTLHVCCYSVDVTLNFKNYESLLLSPPASVCLSVSRCLCLSLCLCLSPSLSHRERERDRQTDRQRQRETDRQTDRDRERQTDRQTETDRQRERETERQRESLPQIGLTPFLHKPPPEKPYQRVERFIISSYTAI